MGRSSRSARSSRDGATVRVAAASADTRSVGRRAHLSAAAILVLLAAATYANTLGHGLVFDDLGFLDGNVALQRPWDLPAIFRGQYHLFDLPTGLYRPLTVWSISVDTWINLKLGLAPAAPTLLHVTNLALHAAAGVAFYFWLVALEWPIRWSLLTAAIFVVHPIHSEAVNAVVGRAEMLAALFGLLFLIWHRQRRHIAWCVLAYLLAMWSKESAATFLAVVVLMDTAFPRGEGARKWPIGRYAAYVATFGVWLALRATNLSGRSLPIAYLDNPVATGPVLPRWLTALRAQIEYLQRLFAPVNLSSDYSYNQIPVTSQLLDPHVIVAVGVMAAIAYLSWRARRAHPAVWFSAAAYLALFATTSNVIVPIGTIMGERLAYAPSIAICLLMGYGAQRLSSRAQFAARAVVVGISLAFACLTLARNRTWSDELTFYRAQVASAPESAKAHFGLGGALARAGRDDAAAVPEYERAIAIYPQYPDAYLNLGNALRRLGAAPSRVIAAYQGALGVDPSYTPALENLARFLILQGREAEAQPLLARLQMLDPGAVRTAP